MFGFFCKRFHGLAPHSGIFELKSTPSQLGFIQNILYLFHKGRSFSSTTTATKEIEGKRYFTVSYLINSCGLSPTVAISASQFIKLKTSEKPDSVLGLLREHEFSETHISNLVRKNPKVLLKNVDDILAKFEFFYSIGFSKEELAHKVTFNTSLLFYSLKNRIIPSYNFLKTFYKCDKKLITILKRRSQMLCGNLEYMMINIEFCKEFGVQESGINYLLTFCADILMQKPEQFGGIVQRVKDMGFDPIKRNFVIAIQNLSWNCFKLTWNRCYKVYQKWGWSEDDIISAFRKRPNCMLLSEENITKKLEFLVKMGWSSTLFVQYPIILLYNLEKRIVPRCLVIKALLSNGLVKEPFSLISAMTYTDSYFLEKFVTKYQEKVPQLLSIFERKLDPQDSCIFDMLK